MKKLIRTNAFKILVTLPALIMMLTIFSFSAQSREQSGSMSMDISRTIIKIENRLLHRDMTDSELETAAKRIEHPLRKCAHVAEYFVLACLLMLSLHVWGMKGKKLFCTVLLITILFAAGDEFHQYLVGDRGPSVKDVMIDTCGVLTGMGVCGLIFTKQ